MKFLIALALLSLTGCGQSELEKAKSDLSFLQKSGVADSQEICEAKQEVAAAARREQSEEFQLLDIDADLECNAVAIEGLRR